VKADGGYQIHAFCDWQMTSDKHAKQVTNGRAGGLAKARNRQQASENVAGASEVVAKTASENLPDKDIDKDIDKDLKPLSADGRKTRLKADWQPSDTIMATVTKKYPLVDIAYESERFTNYWLSTGTPMLDWGRTWQNWMLKKQKELSDQAAKPSLHHPPEDDWMYKVVKWGPERYE
jgi:hypothetical protein